ncbi:MAG: NAD(P)-binding domain-containing protein, partial [Myxococcota bacterium]
MSETGPLGFIGTGTIGAPMAQRLIGAGHELVVCDRVEAATRPLVEAGARRAESPRAVAEACRVVFTSLPGP